MSSSFKYILYLTILHLALGVLAYIAFEGDGLIVLAAEFVLLFSVYFAFRIYRSIISPLQLLGQGAAALEDQDFSVKLMPTGSAEMDRIGKVYNQMIDQLRDERVSSRQREEFLDRLLGAAELGVVILDFDGKLEDMNPWMKKQCEDEAFRTAILEPCMSKGVRGEGVKGVKGEGVKGVKNTTAAKTFVLTGPGNRRYHVERAGFVDRGFERGFLIVQDVTADLLTAEKEAYGKVIRMMAHEVNNSNAAVISVMHSLLEAARQAETELPDLSRDYLPVIINRVENMSTFMRNFARVVRLPSPERKRTNLNEVLRRTGEVMAPVLAEANIGLEYALDDREVIVRADAAQLEQVIVNALTNARQSIGLDGNIRITSTAYPVGFVIADDGPGIPPEVAGDIFTPFFSTKPTGQGVGLTLSRDILEGHEATYQLATEGDGWTRLRVGF